MKKFNKKRILIIGTNEKTSLEMMYYRAFKEIGSSIYLLQIEKNTRKPKS